LARAPATPSSFADFLEGKVGLINLASVIAGISSLKMPDKALVQTHSRKLQALHN